MPLTNEGLRQDRGSAYEADSAGVSSGVSWGAVIGGAFVAAAFALILLALGAGFGLASVSPWSSAGASSTTVTNVAIAWLIVTEVIASALGGYLTGRLRTGWVLVHTDEVYFRDTANGFLAWAVALVIGVTFLASAGSSIVGRMQSESRPSEAGVSRGIEADAYFVDSLFRSDRVEAQAGGDSVRAEAGRIFLHGLSGGGLRKEMSAADQTRLAWLVTARTGIAEPEARKRISDAMTEAREAEDSVRKAAARLLLWSFVALLAGAFSASLAATIGGRQRDHMKAL